ncbi:MAG: RNA 2',3'-cyclic phosphodiesterase [Halioglobus sp.]|nr:RNA 2',3'-cyclic phosphodiesterase [Halioglobus sp.]
MRTFFGLEAEATTAIQIADWRDRQFACDGRPVPPANFHITLAFVGETSPQALENLCLSVDAWLARQDTRGAKLLLDCTGYWPKPGIYWLGPKTWPDTLSALAAKLRQLATNIGARRDRNPFQPHVTLFRQCVTAPLAPATEPAITLAYRHFTLFESRQGKSGVSYHPLQHWELAAPAG